MLSAGRWCQIEVDQKTPSWCFRELPGGRNMRIKNTQEEGPGFYYSVPNSLHSIFSCLQHLEWFLRLCLKSQQQTHI